MMMVMMRMDLIVSTAISPPPKIFSQDFYFERCGDDDDAMMNRIHVSRSTTAYDKHTRQSCMNAFVNAQLLFNDLQ